MRLTDSANLKKEVIQKRQALRAHVNAHLQESLTLITAVDFSVLLRAYVKAMQLVWERDGSEPPATIPAHFVKGMPLKRKQQMAHCIRPLISLAKHFARTISVEN